MSLWQSRHHVTFSMEFGRDAAIVVEPGAVVTVPDRWDGLVVSRGYPVIRANAELTQLAAVLSDVADETMAAAAAVVQPRPVSVPPAAAPAPVAVASEPAPEARRLRPQGSAPVAK